MAWSTIRRATEQDHEKLNKRAAAFIKRHDLENPEWDKNLWRDVNHAIEMKNLHEYDERYLKYLWKRVLRRALGHPMADGIAFGTVGYSVD